MKYKMRQLKRFQNMIYFLSRYLFWGIKVIINNVSKYLTMKCIRTRKECGLEKGIPIN